jgi:hypothetical protein
LFLDFAIIQIKSFSYLPMDNSKPPCKEKRPT